MITNTNWRWVVTPKTNFSRASTNYFCLTHLLRQVQAIRETLFSELDSLNPSTHAYKCPWSHGTSQTQSGVGPVGELVAGGRL